MPETYVTNNQAFPANWTDNWTYYLKSHFPSCLFARNALFRKNLAK